VERGEGGLKAAEDGGAVETVEVAAAAEGGEAVAVEATEGRVQDIGLGLSWCASLMHRVLTSLCLTTGKLVNK